MSGGSLNYVYSQVEDAAREIARRAETPLHRAFAAHVMKVATALHDLEWLFSCDYSDGMEVPALKAVITPEAVLETATARAQAALDELTAALAEVRK